MVVGRGAGAAGKWQAAFKALRGYGIAVGLVLAMTGVQPGEGADAPVSVSDVVRYSFIGDPDRGYGGGVDVGYNEGQLIHGNAASLSPDGRYFAVIVRHGDFVDDETKARLEVFRTESVLGGDIRPVMSVSFASTNARPPIYGIHWLEDSRNLLFIAEKPRVPPQVYMADVTGAVTQLTALRRGVVKFDVTPAGDTLALLVPVGRAACGPGEKRRKYGYTVEVDGLIDAMTGRCRLVYMRQSTQLYVQHGRHRAARIPDAYRVAIDGGSKDEFVIQRCYPMFGGVSISPDGQFAVRTCGIASAPRRWREYESTGKTAKGLRKLLSSGLRQELREGGHGGTMMSLLVQQDVIFDLNTGRAALALDAPLAPGTADMSRPRAWLGDMGHELVLAGVLVRQRGGGWGRKGSFGPAVVEVNAATGARRVVSQNGAGVVGVEWSSKRQELLVDYGADPTDLGDRSKRHRRLFRRRRGRWEAVAVVDSGQSGGAGVRIDLQQSLNHRPVLVATQASSGRKITVLDPNQWLDRRLVAKERKFEWSAHGYTFEAGLYYPLGYSATTRYPLVIQTHGFSPSWFSLYGTSSSGFAAQPLAAHGFLVAQIGRVVREPRERVVRDRLRLFSIEVQGLIKALNRRRMLDTSRIGITGWSSFWLPVENMLAFSGVRFAAAVDADGWDGGYFMYMATDVAQGFADQQWRASPFGSGLRQWLRIVPDFNLERVRTPSLVLAPGLDGLQGNWEFFSGLRRLGKPVEMFYMPSGAHEIVQPDYWYFSVQRVVDWYRFWLQGKEDPDRSKAKQYRAWERLCAKERDEIHGRPDQLHCPDLVDLGTGGIGSKR